MDAATLLANALSEGTRIPSTPRDSQLTPRPDANTRNAAQQQLEAAERDNFVSWPPNVLFLVARVQPHLPYDN